MSSKRVGIFSGSFDPVHDGHISFALEAIQQCNLDKVYFLVEPRPRRKQGVKAFEHRVEMLQLALKRQPKLGTIVLEQARFNVAETLPKLQARFKDAELHMLVGEDVLLRMIEWPNVKDLVKSVHFIIGTRKLIKADLTSHIQTLEKTRGLTFNFRIFTTHNKLVSSTSIRQKLRHGLRPDAINDDVWEYINAHQLYSTKAES